MKNPGGRARKREAEGGRNRETEKVRKRLRDEDRAEDTHRS